MVSEQNEKISIEETCTFCENGMSEEVEATKDEFMAEIQNKISDEDMKKDFGVQVTCGDISVPFISVINTDKKLITMCGLRSSKMLNEIVLLVEKLFPLTKKRMLSTKEQIILVMMKLKLDLSFSVLQILFNCILLTSCTDIFYSMLTKLVAIMKASIKPVSYEEIQNNMPSCFKGFEETAVVLDCSEVHIQRLKCAACRIKIYSQYKSDFTFKFMTGVTPGGMLTFVSKAYGGRASDKAIFEQSNFINSLQKDRDAVMIDKDFLIDDVCAARGIKIIRPPFLRSAKQFTQEEALLNRCIAAARVHVERMNARIRLFAILNNHLSWNLMIYIDEIFIVC